MDDQAPRPRTVSLVNLKEVTRRELPAGHPVRETILSMPDRVARSTFAAQAEILARLLLASANENL